MIEDYLTPRDLITGWQKIEKWAEWGTLASAGHFSISV